MLSLLTGATVWGLIWYPYRVLAALGMPGWVSLTLSYAAAFLFTLAIFRKKVCSFSWMFAWIGLTAGLCNFGYVIAMLNGKVMRVLLLFYLAPLWTILLSRFILKEHLTPKGYLVILFSVTGAVVMLWSPGGVLPRNGAEWLGLASGFMFALSNVLAKRAASYSIEARSASVSLGVVLSGMLFAFFQPIGETTVISPYALWLLVAMGLAIFAVNWVMQYGLSRVPANRAIVILLFELVVAALSSYFLAGEAMRLQEWVGGAMIVAAGFFSSKLET